jgi:hypothetical protein
VTVLLGEVSGFDLDARLVKLAPVAGVPTSLCVAAGSEYSYFGHDEWAASAPEVKSLESAVAARSRIFTAFEKAEVIDDEEQREWSSATVTGATEEARRPSGDAGAAKGKSHLSRHAARGRALAFTRNGSSGRSRRDECVRGNALARPAGAVQGPRHESTRPRPSCRRQMRS